MHASFKSVKGELSLASGKQPSKFCAECALKMVAEKRKLIRHFNGHHPGKEARFLKFDEEPEQCLYENFQAFLVEPTSILIMKEDE